MGDTGKMELSKFRQIQNDLNLNTELWVTDRGIETVDVVDLEMICKYLEIDIDILDKLKGMYRLIEEHRSHRDSTYKEYDKSEMWSLQLQVKIKLFIV